MPKAPKPNTKAKHDPLHVQLGEDEVYSKYGRISQPGRRRKSKAQDDDEEGGDVSPPRVLLVGPKSHASFLRLFWIPKPRGVYLSSPAISKRS